ncbi:TPA: restriction endonuclease subunit S [Clostridioides difficile]|uniref:restriction endonuclease subunit S n=4 Tax=Clostridioides difficile TaxID=1496 RepID=UPI00038D48B1|nr:restriction endonuclease subunit S [Clostridioides difficile]AUA30313.1 restriction endonuclease subunit S [Clostridioides difficile]EAA0001990.1 restriction endonuclease subunit S [Clostridioides difficile]EGT3728584.1 restriction endonuclease subunit S [Clostridioides difficile]EGT3732145.1 restriction endonuclease subunit S [Clostridioides difficile]EGT3771339.1 restriction endonuclease subunit S [Clostridioides difficile]
MEYIKLNELCYINIGKTPSRNTSDYWGSGNRWLSISDLKEKYISKSKEEITDLAVEKANMKLVPKNTVVMSFKLSIGRVAILKEDMFTNEAIANFQIKNNELITSEYLYYALRTLNFNNTDRAVMGATLNKSKLNDIKIPYFTICIQNKMVEVLNKAQELINKRKEQIEALDELVKSRFIEMFGEPINNTKKFDMKKIKEISIYLKRGVSPKYVEQSNIKVINQKCIYWRNLKVENCKYYDENLKEKIEDIFLKQNDILINSTGTGTLGRCVKFNKIDNSEYIADSHVTVLRSISNNLNSDYFAALFEFTNIQDTIYRKCVNGSTNQIELSVSKLGEYLIMVPPIEFQNQFSEFVKQVDKLKLKIETNLKELEDNFNSLMQKAFKGELFN